jgi:hypothetical protein
MIRCPHAQIVGTALEQLMTWPRSRSSPQRRSGHQSARSKPSQWAMLTGVITERMPRSD